MNEFANVFISHRSYDRDKAKSFRDFLITNNIANKVVLWEEESLCRNNEQLTVHDYFEAIERIKESMKSCTAFLYIDSPVFFNGYFTGAEVLQWKRLHDNPYIYRVFRKNDTYYYEKIQLTPLTKSEKHRIGFTSYLSSPDRLYDTEGGIFMDSWGKYATNCFLVSCCNCGAYYLITNGKMNLYTSTQQPAICPHCNQSHAIFVEDLTGKKFFGTRIPILSFPFVKTVADHQPITVDDVIDVMNAKKLPERFPLDKLPNEKLKSDYRKNFESSLKFTLKLLGIIGAIGGICSFLDSKE